MGDIHGILAIKSIFQAEKELIPDSGLMSGRNLYSHWAYLPSTVAEGSKEDFVKLESGDIVTIFKTAAEGPVLWEGTIKFENERKAPDTGELEKDYEYGVHGLQEGMTAIDWSRMFADCRPAVLTTKDGKTIYGSLEQFFETGSEGINWSVQEWGKFGYDGLHCLQDGDELKVFDHVTDGEKFFEGKLTLMPKFTPAAYNKHYKENFQTRPMEIKPDDLMTYCVWHLPVTISRPGAP